MKIDRAAGLLAELGNPTRLRAVRLLVRAGHDGCSVGEIQRALRIPGSTLSHHLAHLRHAGLLRQRRDGATLRCVLDFALVESLVTFLTAECCAEQRGGAEVA